MFIKRAATASAAAFGSREFSDWMPRLEHFLQAGRLSSGGQIACAVSVCLRGRAAGRRLGRRVGARPALPPVVNDGHGDYVYVPAGAFKMGDNFGDGESRERPVHVGGARRVLYRASTR